MTKGVPAKVQARAEAAGFGPLVARCAHPQGRVFAFVYGLCALNFIVPFVLTIDVMSRRGTLDIGSSLANLAFIALGLLFVNQAIGSVTRRAFYLYPQGYLATASSGRVSRVTSWQDVSKVKGAYSEITLQVTIGAFGKRRNVCAIEHHPGKGRTITFTEHAHNAELAPLAYQLHAEATSA